ncbi:unnamed protein product [Protopolystoma xenopodis]|uniref:Uncharacterized protein n=1 Tax=Protopolystoma xenopodis TaxID=117903 RepID=A0A3S5CM56_9PLAT|nr:unnamed protein product [Protopolystoma xenopodis]
MCSLFLSDPVGLPETFIGQLIGLLSLGSVQAAVSGVQSGHHHLFSQTSIGSGLGLNLADFESTSLSLLSQQQKTDESELLIYVRYKKCYFYADKFS